MQKEQSQSPFNLCAKLEVFGREFRMVPLRTFDLSHQTFATTRKFDDAAPLERLKLSPNEFKQ
jgi:hypothetical protein